MAKTMTAAFTDGAGCSYSLPRLSHSPQPIHHRRSRHTHSHPRPTPPSTALLTILGTIVAASSCADGSPTPPTFLCPLVDLDCPSIADIGYSIPSPEPMSLVPTPTKQRTGHRRQVPDKYEQGEDGIWRRVEDEYSLYGSTLCPSCNSDPSASLPSVDDQVHGSASQSASASPTASSFENFLDTLPTGWTPPKPYSGRTTLILVLSLVLAFVICFLIIGCLFWRKSKRRRKNKTDDVEKKARRRRDALGEDAAMIEKEARVKQKIWAKATARWKANARYTARQRRGKRITSTTRTSLTINSTISLEQVQDSHSSTVTSPSPSRPSSRQSSRGPLDDSTPTIIQVTSDEAGPQNSIPSPSSSSSSPSSPTSPPAYHHRVRGSGNDLLPHGGFPSANSTTLPPHDFQGWPSNSHNTTASDHITSNSDMPYTPSTHAAHVATDDKLLLARLADLASAPPDGISAEPSNSHASVPVWHDEEFEDFAVTSGQSVTNDFNEGLRQPSPAPLFPPPPSKGKMAAYDYSLSFENEVESLEPEFGPSAPPFEEGQSAYPVDDSDLIPSAPPLLEVLSQSDFYPSAPEWSPGLPSAPSEISLAQHHDWENALPGHQPHISSDASPFNEPPRLIQGPIASDGTPPGYHR